MSESARARRPRQTMFETAFVSSRVSSAEDLDEVDRLANHPLLQEYIHHIHTMRGLSSMY